MVILIVCFERSRRNKLWDSFSKALSYERELTNWRKYTAVVTIGFHINSIDLAFVNGRLFEIILIKHFTGIRLMSKC
jgi:hypothetical protein